MYMGFEEVLIFMQSGSDYEVLNDVRWFGSGSNAKSSQLIEDPIGASSRQIRGTRNSR